MDTNEQHKRDCLARYILKNWTYARTKLWLSKQPKEFKTDLAARINEQRRRQRIERGKR